MEWVGDLLSAGATVAGGGIFGIFGSIIGQVSRYFQEKQRQSWQREEWQHEKDMFNLQREARAEETEQEIELVSQQGAWNGLSDSIKADAAISANSGWAKDVKALFRPFLTTVLVLCSMWIINMLVNGTLNGFFTADQIHGLMEYSIYSIVFSTATAIAWWWGDRALTPPHLKHR